MTTDATDPANEPQTSKRASPEDNLREQVLKLFGAHLISAKWSTPPEAVADQILALLEDTVLQADRDGRISELEELLWKLAKEIERNAGEYSDVAILDSVDEATQQITHLINQARIEELEKVYDDIRIVVDNHGVIDLRSRVFDRLNALKGTK